MTEKDTAVFWFRSTFRIMDAPQLHEEIVANLGEGSGHHKKGDIRKQDPLRNWKNSIWYIDSPIPEKEDIALHLKWSSDFALDNEEYIRSLMDRGARVDIYIAYCCNEDHRGFGLDPELLSVFPKLGIRFEVSIMT